MPKIHIPIHPIYGNYNNYTFPDTIDKKALHCIALSKTVVICFAKIE